MPEICPVCGSPHDTYGGVAMHMVKKTDEEHAQWSTKDGAIEHLAAEGLIGVGSSGEGDMIDTSEPDTPEPVEPDTSTDGGNPLVGSKPPKKSQTSTEGQCCSDPNLSACGGQIFELDDGSHVRANDLDRFCSSCGAIVEPTGEVLR